MTFPTQTMQIVTTAIYQHSIAEEGFLEINFKNMAEEQENMQWCLLSCRNKSPFSALCVCQAVNFTVKRQERKQELHDPPSSPHQFTEMSSFFGNDSYDTPNPTDKICFFSIPAKGVTIGIAHCSASWVGSSFHCTLDYDDLRVFNSKNRSHEKARVAIW